MADEIDEKAAKACAEFDRVLDDIIETAKEALAKSDPVIARGAVAMSMLMSGLLGRSDAVIGICASAVLRLAQQELIDAEVGERR